MKNLLTQKAEQELATQLEKFKIKAVVEALDLKARAITKHNAYLKSIDEEIEQIIKSNDLEYLQSKTSRSSY